jgi:hypothetical protein
MDLWNGGKKLSSCQITGIKNETWRAFRLICLEEGISANRKLRQLIEAQVRLGDDDGMDGKEETTEPRGIETKGISK